MKSSIGQQIKLFLCFICAKSFHVIMICDTVAKYIMQFFTEIKSTYSREGYFWSGSLVSSCLGIRAAKINTNIITHIFFSNEKEQYEILSQLRAVTFDHNLRGVRWLSGRVLDTKSRALLDALRCVLEQGTLSSAKYWFNPGRPVPA